MLLCNGKIHQIYNELSIKPKKMACTGHCLEIITYKDMTPYAAKWGAHGSILQGFPEIFCYRLFPNTCLVQQS